MKIELEEHEPGGSVILNYQQAMACRNFLRAYWECLDTIEIVEEHIKEDGEKEV